MYENAEKAVATPWQFSGKQGETGGSSGKIRRDADDGFILLSRLVANHFAHLQILPKTPFVTAGSHEVWGSIPHSSTIISTIYTTTHHDKPAFCGSSVAKCGNNRPLEAGEGRPNSTVTTAAQLQTASSAVGGRSPLETPVPNILHGSQSKRRGVRAKLGTMN